MNTPRLVLILLTYTGSAYPVSATAQPQQEKVEATLDIARNWQRGGDTPDAYAGENGATVFFYGRSSPTIVCAVLQVCDLALEPGEEVSNVHIGDSVRWSVAPSISGEGETLRTHVLIKPMHAGIKTSLFIPTSKRTYHIQLIASEKDYMPHVSFRYPEQEERDAWTRHKVEQTKLLAEKLARERHDRQFQIPETQDDVRDLDFNYEITGMATWRPLRVYNNGKKTIIEFPKTLHNQNAPVLLAVSRTGWFRKSKKLINYRVSKNKYIVDSVFDEGVLIVGVGRDQTRVQIKRIK